MDVASIAVNMVFAQKARLQANIAARSIESNTQQNAALIAQALTTGATDVAAANLKGGIGQLLDMDA
jgi:hypothetical protein